MKKRVLIIFFAVVAVLIAGWRSYDIWGEAIYNTESVTFPVTGEISQGMVITQGFTCKYDNLTGISIKISNLGHEVDSEISYKLKEQGKIIVEGRIDCSKLESGSINEINFSQSIENSKDKTYVIELQDSDTTEGSGIALYTTDSGELAGQLSINQEKHDQVLMLKALCTRFNLEHFIVFLGLMLYLALFVMVLNKFFN